MRNMSKSIRDQVLRRDWYECVKCGRESGLNVHHIVAVQDGGSDKLENLITLCLGCHKEWHAIEVNMALDFNTWVKLPTYAALITAYMTKTPDDLTVKEYKESVIMVDAMRRMIRK